MSTLESAPLEAIATPQPLYTGEVIYLYAFDIAY